MRIIVLVGWVLISSAASAQFPVIELTVISPRAGQAGTSLELRVAAGTNTEQVDRLVFSDPRITAEVLSEEPPPAAAEGTAEPAAEGTAEAAAPDAAKDAKPAAKWGHFRVSIPADVPAGQYEVCAVGAYGISNPRVFSVSASPVVTLAAVSKSLSEPTSLDEHLGPDGSLVVDHQSTAAQVDYFRFSGSAKQPPRVRVDAQRIDSRMIPQIKLLAPDGRTVAAARGADGFDAGVTIPAGQAGEFTLAVHDFLFRGGESFFYTLRIETEDASVAAVHSGEPSAERLRPDRDSLEAATVATSTAGAFSSAEGQNPAGSLEQPIGLVPPCEYESRFGDPRGEQVFHFEASEAAKLSIEVISQRLGQPTDPRLIIERQEVKPDAEILWHVVANEDDPAVVGDAAMRLRSKDPVVQFAAPATATYRIRLRNLDTGRSLAEQPAYRLILREPSPDFDLVAMFAHPHSDVAQSRPRGCQLMRGDSQSIRVLAVRREGFAGPIEVSIPELPAGLTCRPVTIAANQSEAHLTLVASDDAAAWSGPVQVVGKATGGDGEFSRTAAAATFIWGSGEGRDFIRSRLATKLMLSVTDQQQSPLSIQLGGDEAAGGKPGTDVSLPIKLTRGEGAATPVVLRPRNLPPGVTAAEVTIPADQSEGALAVKVAADAKPGSYSFWVQGESKVKFKAMTQTDPAELTVFVSSTTANLELTGSQ